MGTAVGTNVENWGPRNGIGRILEVQYNTAWFMSHRIREAMRVGGLMPPMGSGGVVEIDETIYGRAATHPKGRGPFGTKLTNAAHKNVILSLVERGGEVRSYHVAGSTVSEVIPIVEADVAKEAASDDRRGPALQTQAW